MRFRRRRADGTEVVTESSSVPVTNDAGDVVGFRGTERDVSERVRAENERRELQARIRRQAVSHGLAVLAGGLAHAFNNVLVGVSGNAELLKEALAGDAAQRRRAEEIEVAATEAADICGHLLAYAGHAQEQRLPHDVAEIVEETVERERAAAPAGVRVRVEIEPGLPAVRCDTTQVRQLVGSVVANAVEACDGDGNVTVRVGVAAADDPRRRAGVLRRADVLERAVLLTVEDDGEGICESRMPRIFDPFFSTKEGAHGLGLAAAVGIVQRHGGDVHVASAPGRGTTLAVWFPALRAPVERAPAERGADRVDAAAPRTVMVVDDEAMVRQVASAVLTSRGFDVLLADGGQAALDLHDERGDDIDAVVLDVSMPGMSGPECLEQLLSRRPDLPVVIASGFAGQTLDNPALRQPTVTHLAKPYRADALADAIRSVAGAQAG